MEGQRRLNNYPVNNRATGPRLDYGPPEMVGSESNYADVMLRFTAGREIGYDNFFDLFQEVEFFDEHQSYAAVEFTFSLIKAEPEVEKITCGQRDFLYRDDHRVGILMNFLLYKKPSTTPLPFEHDICNRITNFSSTKSSISAFFKNYPNAILAVDVGDEAHDSMLFMRKMGKGFDYVHFSPNYDHRVPIAEHVFLNMSKERRVRGYNAEDGGDPWNTRASCSAHTWQQAYNFMRFGFNPFNRAVLRNWDLRYRFWIYEDEILVREEIERRDRARLRYPNGRPMGD